MHPSVSIRSPLWLIWLVFVCCLLRTSSPTSSDAVHFSLSDERVKEVDRTPLILPVVPQAKRQGLRWDGAARTGNRDGIRMDSHGYPVVWFEFHTRIAVHGSSRFREPRFLYTPEKAYIHSKF